jgi:hypothetical protein
VVAVLDSYARRQRLSPEQRARTRERVQATSPEERRRWGARPAPERRRPLQEAGREEAPR